MASKERVNHNLKGKKHKIDMEILTCDNFYVFKTLFGDCLGQEMVQSVHAGKFCMAQIGLGP